MNINKNQVLSLVRSVLKAVGGAFIANGIDKDSTKQAVIGALTAIVGLIWSHWEHTPDVPTQPPQPPQPPQVSKP